MEVLAPDLVKVLKKLKKHGFISDYGIRGNSPAIVWTKQGSDLMGILHDTFLRILDRDEQGETLKILAYVAALHAEEQRGKARLN